MRICRFNEDRLGVVADDTVIDVTEALREIPLRRWPYPAGDALIANWDAVRGGIDAIAANAPKIPFDRVALKSPIANPTKIIGIARNRKNLAAENTDAALSGNGRG